MDKKPLNLMALLFIATLATLVFSFYKFFLHKDYTSYSFSDCNVTVHNCFVRICEDGDPRCMDQSIDGNYYFSILEERRDTKNTNYCSSENLIKYSDVVYDAECSTPE